MTPAGLPDQSAAASALYLYRRLRLASTDGPNPDDYLGPLILYVVTTSSPADLTALLHSPGIRDIADQNQALTDEVGAVFTRLVQSGTIVSRGGHFGVSEEVAQQMSKVQSERRRIVEAAYNDFRMKLKSQAPRISDSSVTSATSHFDAVLVESYRKRGLSLACSIFAKASAKGDTLTELYRLLAARAGTAFSIPEEQSAFTVASHQFLIDPTPSQKEYLGAISQGFFLYHLLGCDPTCASLRLETFRKTLWLVDSNVLLALLAQGCFQYDYAHDLFAHLVRLQAVLFTTDKLAREAFEHLKWARANTPANPAMSAAFLATAVVKGSVTQNLFIDGFIRLSAESQVVDFDDYLALVLPGAFTFDNFRNHLASLRVQILSDGEVGTNVLISPDHRIDLERKIRSEREQRGIFKSDLQVEAEAEVVALLDAVRTKVGRLAELAVDQAYFVSTSRVLDRIVGPEGSSTWSAEAVYRYIKALPGNSVSADLLQQCMLQEFYFSGTAFIDRPRYFRFFGAQIEEAKLSFAQQKTLYVSALERVGGRQKLEEEFARTPELEKPYFVSQMGWAVAAAAERSKGMAQQETRREAEARRQAEAQVRALIEQRDEAWRKREKRKLEQAVATERNKLDPKHLRKRDRQAKRRRRKLR